MVIVRQGATGTIAITLPHGYQQIAEQIHDALCKAYAQATVRVVVNHCLAPEIVRADRVDVAFARSLVEQLRAQAPAPIEPSSLHEKIAVCLGWTVEETHSFSLRALRDLVHKHDPRLAAQIELAASKDPGEKAYCCFCSGVVEPADYVVYAHAPGSDRPAHRECRIAHDERAQAAQNAADHVFMLTRLLFETQPRTAILAALSGAWDDNELRAMCAIVLGG